jgi:hypothetical protein
MLLRLAYRFSYLVLLGSGRVAARLAADFRVLAHAGERLGPLTVVLQLPLVLCWLVVRPISLAAFSACSALAPRLRLPEPSA